MASFQVGLLKSQRQSMRKGEKMSMLVVACEAVWFIKDLQASNR